MPLHGTGTEVEPGTNLWIGEPVAGHPRDLQLLRRQVGAGVAGPLACGLTGRRELHAGAFGERLHPDRGELFVGAAQMLTRIDPASLTPQPLAVEQVCARELGPQQAAAESLDRVPVQAVGPI